MSLQTAISCEAVERRILALDQQENDYFIMGMHTAVKKAEARGFVLPPIDFEKYAVKKEDPPAESQEVTQEEATELSSESPAVLVISGLYSMP